MASTATFKKGMAVKIKPQLDYNGEPRKHWDTGMVLCHRIWRNRTEADHAEWLASDASKGMDDAGESKLDSRSRSRYPGPDELFKVIRSRVKAPDGWGETSGCAQVMDADGVHWFVKREHMH